MDFVIHQAALSQHLYSCCTVETKVSVRHAKENGPGLNQAEENPLYSPRQMSCCKIFPSADTDAL